MNARDEARHPAGAGESWEESWDFEFVAPDGTLGGFVRTALYPNRRRAWCWVYVLRADGTVVVRDHDVPMPREAEATLLIRAEGLWCELICETPLEHWSIGVEAFGVRLDDPLDGLRGEIGTRLPVGLDLEWEASSPPDACDELERGYRQSGVMHGDVLLGQEVIALDGVGARRHLWGRRDWRERTERVSCAAGTPVGATAVLDAFVPLTEDDAHPAHLAHLERSLVQCLLADGSGALGWRERVVI